MSSSSAYQNVAVVEALFDIKTVLPQEIDIVKLQTFQEKFKTELPKQETKVEWKATFQVKPDVTASFADSPAKKVGFMFSPENRSKLVQARFDGFTFNKLKPYNGWGPFSSEAKIYWNHYVEITKPIKITRVALRYINRIEIPLPISTLDDYLKTKPIIASDIPQTLDDFFLRLTIAPTDGQQNAGIITIAVDGSNKNPAILPLILDIDVFRLVNMDMSQNHELWDIIQSLRVYKNLIFKSSITDKTRSLLKI